jgi:hypothetical protein
MMTESPPQALLTNQPETSMPPSTALLSLLLLMLPGQGQAEVREHLLDYNNTVCTGCTRAIFSNKVRGANTPVLAGPEPPNQMSDRQKSYVLVSNCGTSDTTPAVGSMGPRRIYLAISDLCPRLEWSVQDIEN